jgi:hypothetical protein
MPTYTQPYKIYYYDRKNKLQLSEGEKIELENGFVSIYGSSDPLSPKRIVPMDKVAEILRNYPTE